MYHGERFNAVSHLIGAILALAGAVLLLLKSLQSDDLWVVIALSVYSATLVLMYLASTLYHSTQGRTKAIFRKLDHLCIYLLIAGTYTPFTLVTLHGGWGWTLFAIVWTLAAVGIVLELRHKKEARIIQVFIYVGMGWLILIAIKPLIDRLPPPALALLVAGGISYTAGILFYALDDKVKHFHGIWHLFVLVGSICQYLAILFYVG